jgi:hypothetical protein
MLMGSMSTRSSVDVANGSALPRSICTVSTRFQVYRRWGHDGAEGLFAAVVGGIGNITGAIVADLLGILVTFGVAIFGILRLKDTIAFVILSASCFQAEWLLQAGRRSIMHNFPPHSNLKNLCTDGRSGRTSLPSMPDLSHCQAGFLRSYYLTAILLRHSG